MSFGLKSVDRLLLMVDFESGSAVGSDCFIATSILEFSMRCRLDYDSDPLMQRFNQSDQITEMKIRGRRVLTEKEDEEAGALGELNSAMTFFVISQKTAAGGG